MSGVWSYCPVCERRFYCDDLQRTVGRTECPVCQNEGTAIADTAAV
jgi:hypothetical protein